MSLPYREVFGGRSQPLGSLLGFDALGDDPEHYLADEGLVHAVNTSLLLGRPLLVTGEPGTGKTQLAASIALQLDLGKPLPFVAKSTSQAQDLFYTLDTLGRFKSSAARGDGPANDVLPHLRYNSLGTAILFANDPVTVEDIVPAGFAHPGQRRSVVLIDEVDKAPRDFPNDILAEIEQMSFRIPELDRTVSAGPTWRPVVVITSNSERALPDAFMRRCIYYDIPFPTLSRLERILKLKLANYFDKEFADAALGLLDELRSDRLGLGKKPSTAELISWMIALIRREALELGARDGTPVGNPLRNRERALEMLGALVKSREDLKRARSAVERWVSVG